MGFSGLHLACAGLTKTNISEDVFAIFEICHPPDKFLIAPVQLGTPIFI
jgi:hypothetical protein